MKPDRSNSSAAVAVTSVAAVDVNPPDGPGSPMPMVRNPRARSGDLRHEPKWEEQMTNTVGNRDADLNGSSERVIQAAVDAVARAGTVKLLPGTFRLRNAVYVASHVRLVGSGLDLVLLKELSVSSKLAADSDWYDQEITLADAAGFKIGDGVCTPEACTRTTSTSPARPYSACREPLSGRWRDPAAGAAR